MFTGIVEELGKICRMNKDLSGKIAVECGAVTQGTKLGDSIAVNGVCLTVTELLSNGFVADVSPETFKVTSLGYLGLGSFVNLERAMTANGRFGGHMVSGHIDGLGNYIETIPKGDCYELTFKLNPELMKYIVKKGSVAINGVSLTVADIESDIIKIAIIPHTYKNTNLQLLQKGDFVNIEVDIIAKYVEKFLSSSDNKSRISLEYLQEHGF